MQDLHEVCHLPDIGPKPEGSEVHGRLEHSKAEYYEAKIRQDERIESSTALLIGRQKEPVLVILNRPELSTKDDASEYIRTMPAVAKETRGVLKVLVVIRNGVWDIDKNRAGIARSKLLRTLCLDQRRV